MSVANYVKASYNELVNKVTWPTWQQLVNSAIVVVIASLIFSLIIFVMDLASEGFTDLVYSILNSNNG